MSKKAGQNLTQKSFILDKGHCLYIRTKPSGKVGVWKEVIENDGSQSYGGYKYKADKKGILRLIIAKGNYKIVYKRDDWQQPSIAFDYENEVYATVNRL